MLSPVLAGPFPGLPNRSVSDPRTTTRAMRAQPILRWAVRSLWVTALALPVSAQQSLSLSNGLIDVDYAVDPNLGLVLTGLSQSSGNLAFTLEPGRLWTVEVKTPAGATVQVTPDPAALFQLDEFPDHLEARWRNVPVAGGGTIHVTGRLELLPGEPLASFSLDVDASHLPPTNALHIQSVEYGRIQVVEPWAQADGTLAVPYAEGVLIMVPTKNLAPLSSGWVHPQELSMQWLSFYDRTATEGPCFFFGTRDPDGWRKEFPVRRPSDGSPAPHWLGFSTRIYPSDYPNAVDHSAPFPVVFGLLQGDWYDAARFYRNWALSQPFAGAPMESDPSFSSLVRDARLFAAIWPSSCCDSQYQNPFCNSGLRAVEDDSSFQYWKARADELVSRFGGPIVMKADKWDFDARDARWGAWLPPHPGYASAAPAVANAGYTFAHYFLCTLYARDAPDAGNLRVPGYWGHAAVEYAIRDEAGEPVHQIERAFVGWQPGCQSAAQSKWVRSDFLDARLPFMVDLAKYVIDVQAALGAKGVYLDTFSVFAGVPDYYDFVGRPEGGGSAYTQAKLAVVDAVRDHGRNDLGIPDYFVMSEGPQELYVNRLEIVYGNHTPVSEYVPIPPGQPLEPLMLHAPLWSTVYNERQIVTTVLPLQLAEPSFPYFNDPVALQFARRAWAAHVFGGRLPYFSVKLSWLSLAAAAALNPEYRTLVQLAENSMKVLGKDEARAFYVFGSRVRDPKTTSPTIVWPLETGGSKGVYYDPAQPFVYASAWAREAEGRAAILLSNWTSASDQNSGLFAGTSLTPGDQTISITLDPEDLLLTPGNYRVDEVTPTGTVSFLPTLNLNGVATIPNVTVPQKGVRFFIIHP